MDRHGALITPVGSRSGSDRLPARGRPVSFRDVRNLGLVVPRRYYSVHCEYVALESHEGWAGHRRTNRWTGATAGELLIKVVRFYHWHVLAGGGPVNSAVRWLYLVRNSFLWTVSQ